MYQPTQQPTQKPQMQFPKGTAIVVWIITLLIVGYIGYRLGEQHVINCVNSLSQNCP